MATRLRRQTGTYTKASIVSRLDNWKRRAAELKTEVHALYLAIRDPRTPWMARLLAGLVLAYALSPIDLIPDFIPILGYLDDLILVPLGLALVIRLIPDQVLQDCRVRAASAPGLPPNYLSAILIVILWLALLTAAILLALRHFR
jgi:uncharacterized membrane protein YkvA (DUF1232 family)